MVLRVSRARIAEGLAWRHDREPRVPSRRQRRLEDLRRLCILVLEMNADLAMQRALDQLKRVGFAGLSDEDKALAAIWYFESKVANSGFARYFTAVDGELARYAPVAFRAVGARTQAEIAEQANAVFGPEGVPLDPRHREEALRQLSPGAQRTFDALEKRYFESARDLEDRLERFLERPAPAHR